MPRSHSLVLFAAASLWAGAAIVIAQEQIVPAPASESTSAASIRQGAGLSLVDGDQLLGVGWDYNAWFGPQGMAFTPALGERAPHDLPLAFATVAVGRGDERGPVADAVRSHAERTVSYTRGGMVETYEVRHDGVKQNFVFHTLPTGRGDLVVRGQVTSELQAGPITDAGITWSLPGIGGVHIGNVLGIDAAGRQVAGSMSLGADGLEFRLPAAFVDAAVLPLVLDPPFGTSVTIGGNNDDFAPDLAWDASNACYLAVWARSLSATNMDIRGQRLDSDGVAIGSTISIENNAATFALRPKVANINGENAFVVVYSYGGDVFAKGVSASSGALTAEATVATGSNNQLDIVVGGEALDFAGGLALAAWRDATLGNITVRSIGYTPFSLILGATSTAAGNALSLADLAISRSGGENGRWLLSWTRDPSGVADIYGRVYERNTGFVTGGTALVTDALECRLPAVDGDGISWVLAFARNEGGLDYDVLARPVRYDAGALIVGAIQTIAADNSDNETNPSVGWIGNSALVGWQDETTPGIFDTYVRSIEPLGCQVCEGSYSLGVTTNNEFTTAIATKASGGAFGSRDAAVMWAQDIGNLGDVLFWRWRARHGAYTSLGGGCGNGGEALAPCANNPNANFRLRLRNGPSSTTVWGILGFERNDYVCGPCVLIPNPFTGVVWSQTTNSFGDVELNLPTVAGSGGLQFYLQYVSLGPSCPLGLEMSSSILVGIEN
jgi:hypothetical protein